MINLTRAPIALDPHTESLVIGGSPRFWAAKRFFDIVFSIVLLVPLGLAVVVLLILNPFLNQGPLFFVQVRMGQNCRAFRLYKFRSMRCTDNMRRGASDPIEQERITAFGLQLRKSRIDELPQILNVLRGEMSLIGPRPDFFHHARSFVRVMPHYRFRHQIRPGISGLAQVTHGYAEGVDATHDKVDADLAYIRNAGFKLDAILVLKTIRTVLLREGA